MTDQKSGVAKVFLGLGCAGIGIVTVALLAFVGLFAWMGYGFYSSMLDAERAHDFAEQQHQADVIADGGIDPMDALEGL